MDGGAASWRTIRYGGTVSGADGEPLGTIVEVLGSDAEDIFHGLRVRLHGDDHDRVVPANDVTSITPLGVETDLVAADLVSLEVYAEEATFHLGTVGRFRKHVGWRADDKSDEEPG
jgi:hypothetical protein